MVHGVNIYYCLFQVLVVFTALYILQRHIENGNHDDTMLGIVSMLFSETIWT